MKYYGENIKVKTSAMCILLFSFEKVGFKFTFAYVDTIKEGHTKEMVRARTKGDGNSRLFLERRP